MAHCIPRGVKYIFWGSRLKQLRQQHTVGVKMMITECKQTLYIIIYMGLQDSEDREELKEEGVVVVVTRRTWITAPFHPMAHCGHWRDGS